MVWGISAVNVTKVMVRRSHFTDGKADDQGAIVSQLSGH
jgi:hypothetical protein